MIAAGEAAPRTAARWREGVRLRHVWVLVTLVATFIVPAVSPAIMVDLAWTLQGGAWMVANGRLLDGNPFTWAPAAATQVNQQWLAQLVYYGIYALAGLEGAIAFSAVAVVGAFGLVLLAAHEASRRLRLSCAVTILAFLLAASNLGGRAQTLAYPLFGLFVLAFGRALYSGDGRLLWLLPAAMVVWANVHGSFVLGLGLVVCLAAGKALEARTLAATRQPLLALGGCVLAACVTPYGAGSLLYVASIGGNPLVRDYLTEWAAPPVTSYEGATFYASAALLAGVALLSRTRLRPAEWLALAAFAGLAASSARAVVWWGLLMTPILARVAAGLPLPGARRAARPSVELPAVNLAIALAVAALAVSSLPWVKPLNPVVPPAAKALIRADTPVAAAELLRAAKPAGRMFNFANWGAYLTWVLWPDQQPFIDTRAELYQFAAWEDYLAISYPAADWQARLDRLGVDVLVLSRQQQADLVAAVERSNGWRLVHQDALAAVFVRR